MKGTREDAATAAHMIAVCALSMIEQDAGLIERLKAEIRESDCPISADQINPLILNMCATAIALVGRRVADQVRAGRPVEELQIPIPRTENGLEHSAGAMAVGSFTTEFVRTDELRRQQFAQWMADKKLAIGGDGDLSIYCTPDRLEEADRMLTMMAHAVGHMVEAGITTDPDYEGPTRHIYPERDSYGPHKGYNDDGSRAL